MNRYEPGSIGFCHSKGIIGWAIRLGERLRFRKGSFWNHVFIVSDQVDEHGEQLVIQAIASGVDNTKPLSNIAPGGKYEIVALPEGIDAALVIKFANMQVGDHYGYLSIIGTALRILMPHWLPLPYIRTGSSWYCSALGAEAARAGGWLHKWPDIYNVVPSEFYAALNNITMAQLRARP